MSDDGLVAKQLLTNFISKNDIVIFSKPSCCLCDEIKSFLQEHAHTFLSVDVTLVDEEYDVDGVDLVEELKTQTGKSMYPFCFHKGQCVDTHELKKKLINFDFEEDKDF